MMVPRPGADEMRHLAAGEGRALGHRRQAEVAPLDAGPRAAGVEAAPIVGDLDDDAPGRPAGR